jgi:hypothetical protein
MTVAADVFTACKRRGVILVARGNGIDVTGPQSAIDELATLIQLHCRDLVELLAPSLQFNPSELETLVAAEPINEREYERIELETIIEFGGGSNNRTHDQQANHINGATLCSSVRNCDRRKGETSMTAATDNTDSSVGVTQPSL